MVIESASDNPTLNHKLRLFHLQDATSQAVGSTETDLWWPQSLQPMHPRTVALLPESRFREVQVLSH